MILSSKMLYSCYVSGKSNVICVKVYMGYIGTNCTAASQLGHFPVTIVITNPTFNDLDKSIKTQCLYYVGVTVLGRSWINRHTCGRPRTVAPTAL